MVFHAMCLSYLLAWTSLCLYALSKSGSLPGSLVALYKMLHSLQDCLPGLYLTHNSTSLWSALHLSSVLKSGTLLSLMRAMRCAVWPGAWADLCMQTPEILSEMGRSAAQSRRQLRWVSSWSAHLCPQDCTSSFLSRCSISTSKPAYTHVRTCKSAWKPRRRWALPMVISSDWKASADWSWGHAFGSMYIHTLGG